jgi:hypothetical protein
MIVLAYICWGLEHIQNVVSSELHGLVSIQALPGADSAWGDKQHRTSPASLAPRSHVPPASSKSLSSIVGVSGVLRGGVCYEQSG